MNGVGTGSWRDISGGLLRVLALCACGTLPAAPVEPTCGTVHADPVEDKPDLPAADAGFVQSLQKQIRD